MPEISNDLRNVRDEFKWWLTEDIKDNLKTTQSGFIPIFLNIHGDFNLSSGIRNSNWFNTTGPVIAGRKQWDRRGAVGAQNYTDIQYWPVKNDEAFILCLKIMRNSGYRLVAAEITENAIPITTYEWQERSAVIFGEEQAGIPEQVLDFVDDVVYIPGRGSVRSLNVATTSGIFEYDYSMKRELI